MVLGNPFKNIDQALDVILDYIEDNYIGVFRRGHFRHVPFLYEMWGFHDRVQNDLPRTNNGNIGSTNILDAITPVFGN